MARPLADPERPALRPRLEPLERRTLVHVRDVDDESRRVDALVVFGVRHRGCEQLCHRFARGLRGELQDRGGIGGARFLRGLQAAAPDAELTVVVNTGDDITMYGLRICPDLDTVMYTLGGGIDEQRGWGRQDETFHAREELQAYDVPTAWFGLGDRDLATHLVRRQMLDAGYPLSQVTQALCARWQPGARLLPMSDDRV